MLAPEGAMWSLHTKVKDIRPEIRHITVSTTEYCHNLTLECRCADRGVLRQRLHCPLLQPSRVPSRVSSPRPGPLRIFASVSLRTHVYLLLVTSFLNSQLVVTITFDDVTDARHGAITQSACRITPT